MHTIDLGDDLYRRLQKHAVAWEDAPADVITRALDALDRSENGSGKPRPEQADEEVPEWQRKPKEIIAGVGDLVNHTGRVPHGTKLRTRYRGKEFHAIIDDGRVVWDGQRYSSLSQAAVAVIHSTGSRRPTENGWRFWEYFNEQSGEWEPLGDLRADPLMVSG